MKNKYLLDCNITNNDLFFMCYMIEEVARELKQKNKYVVNSIGRSDLYHLVSCVNILRNENPLKLVKDWIEEYHLQEGNFNIINVDEEIKYIIPSSQDMAIVYEGLIINFSSTKEDYIDALMKVYNDPICEMIDDYDKSAIDIKTYIILRSYQNDEINRETLKRWDEEDTPIIYSYNKRDITLCMIIQIRAVVDILQKVYDISFIDAVMRFYDSKTYETLQQTQNGLWAESAGYIADRYFEEIGEQHDF